MPGHLGLGPRTAFGCCSYQNKCGHKDQSVSASQAPFFAHTGIVLALRYLTGTELKPNEQNMSWEGWKAWKWGKGNHIKSANSNYKAKTYSTQVTSIRILQWQPKRYTCYFNYYFLLVVVWFSLVFQTFPLLHGKLKIFCISEVSLWLHHILQSIFPPTRRFFTTPKAIIPEFLQKESSFRGALCLQSPSCPFRALAVCIPQLQHRVQRVATPDLSPTTRSGQLEGKTRNHAQLNKDPVLKMLYSCM